MVIMVKLITRVLMTKNDNSDNVRIGYNNNSNNNNDDLQTE